MEVPQIPGLDRGVLVASFAGAVAYLITQDKLPPLRAAGYVVVGGMVAAYIGPATIETLADHYQYVIGEKTRYALIFMTGVCGIWILNLAMAVMQALKENVGGAVGKWVAKVFGPGEQK